MERREGEGGEAGVASEVGGDVAVVLEIADGAVNAGCFIEVSEMWGTWFICLIMRALVVSISGLVVMVSL